MELFLTIAVWILILDRFIFGRKDKMARKAIQELAGEFNREVNIYDFIKEVSIYVKDYHKEMKKERARFEDKRENFETTKRILENFGKETSEELQKIVDKFQAGDREVVEGVNALAEHLGVKLEAYTIPEKEGIKVEKIKRKSKK